ncbi:MAG: mannose-6-phosphate isomerase, class I [Desulfobacterales bacterium]|nr:mannose-6-phosphate isomerase, class I [Desulfobacterales bacterium]
MTGTPVFLDNPVQNYAWGSKTAIQKLLGLKPDGHTPWAELWMGSHPKSPSKVLVNGERINLDEWAGNNAQAVLGEHVAGAYNNTLPYLFKVLAAEQPLSIQAHPDSAQAAKGFERENRQGVPFDAPHRNYRDPRGKPELICAIEPFGAMIGFRDPESIIEQLSFFCPNTMDRQIRALAGQPDSRGIRQFFHDLLNLDEIHRRKILDEALKRSENFGGMEAAWIKKLHEFYPDDIGVLAPSFLNLVEIKPGKAVYLRPGVIHAYLYGTGIEIMANSDNVLRGGLTSKHIDAAELTNILRFDFKPPELLEPGKINSAEKQYITEAKEFTLSVIETEPDTVYHGPEKHSTEILFCLKGSALIGKRGGGQSLSVSRGGSVLVPAAAGRYEITGSAFFYKAGVPL